jgi:hypothetical protein
MPIAANPGTQTSAGPISDETLTQLDQNPAEVSKLALKDKYALVDHLMAPKEETPEAPAPAEAPAKVTSPAEEADKAAAAETEEPQVSKDEAEDEPAEKPLRKDRRYWKEKAQREADEKNRIKQQYESAQRRLEALKKVEEEAKAIKAEKPLDAYDDAQMTSLATKLAQMEKELAGYRDYFKTSAQQEAESAQKSLQQREEESVFTSIARLQSEFEDLRTDQPFEKLNAEYASWLDNLVKLSGFKESHPNAPVNELRSMAKELYNEDEDFRKTAIAKRAKAPKELEKIETILNVHEKKMRDGGGYRANYLDMLAENGVLPSVIAKREREAALKASNATIDAMTRGNKGVTTLAPTDGSNSFPDKTPAEKMQAYLKDLHTRVARGHRMNSEEKAQAMTYMQLLSEGAQ